MSLRILCIHGYRQTGNTFREKSGYFRKILKGSCEFVFIDSPLKIPSPADTVDQGFGWWFSQSDDSFDPAEHTDFLRGFDESVEVVKNALKEQGPFDGIFAFSQGAAFVTLLQLLMEQHPQEWNAPTVNFAILVAPFRSRSSLHAPLYKGLIKMPTLLVYGRDDKVIPAEMTEELLPLYTAPQTTFVHPGGHMIPTTAAAKEAFRTFIGQFLPNVK
ncbi:Ovarian cancer-associated -like protein [Echinococcus granulosus]|uniref:Ovarian cancer associated gene 2 protein n=1 Tax=Echinococcus granulosus TaxID=6210 RepID=A0A068WWV0_ECHGR|nr:Ovarian cancer-associated -like protein [Echinococcus granulosus]CDS22186.1 ovarian cancer associated gene 2 protein [Echinococcus granulosus]